VSTHYTDKQTIQKVNVVLDIINHAGTPTMSVGVGRAFGAFCLSIRPFFFVRRIKRMHGSALRCVRSD